MFKLLNYTKLKKRPEEKRIIIVIMCQKPLINYPTRATELPILFGICLLRQPLCIRVVFSFNNAIKAGKVGDLESILYLKM